MAKKKPQKKKDKSTKKPKQNRGNGEIKKKMEYQEYIHFCSLPRALRSKVMGAKDNQEFCEKFGLSMDTLTDWKQRAGFWDSVLAVRKEFFKDRTADVILAVETKAIKTGDAAEARLMLDYTGELKKEEKDPDQVPILLAEAINKISKIL